MRLLLKKIRKILRDRRARQMLTRIVSTLAAVVVFVTTYALVLPAITMESQAACGIPAHQHDDSCYEEVLVCGLPEGDGHTHTDACYTVVSELVCGLQEHQHADGCYDAEGNLICGKTDHLHEESCYQENRTLTCGLEETEGHQHDASCYEKQLKCDMEAHTHSAACYSHASGNGTAGSSAKDYAVVAATTEAADGAASGAGNTGTNTDRTTDAAAGTDLSALPAEEDAYVPELEALFFDQFLTKKTGIYYFHPEEGDTIPESAEDIAAITDWTRVDEDTKLDPNDILRVYLRYTIPAGSLNSTNPVARYRLPANLHLTDQQMEEINTNVNGIANQYVNLDTLEILDPDQYNQYLGIEAVEGTRTPADDIDEYFDKHPDMNGQEYINATVQAENVYDTEGHYGEKDAYLGQALIFTFTPYTVQKNQNEYDVDGQPTKAGEKVQGWLCLDVKMDQVDWGEAVVTTEEEDGAKTSNTDASDANVNETAESAPAHKTLIEQKESNAEIVFATEDKALKIDEISTNLRKIERTETISDEDAEKSDQASPEEKSGEEGTDETDDAAAVTDSATEINAETYPAASFEDSIVVHAGTLSTDNESAAKGTPEETTIAVSVTADAETFPRGTTMVLGAVDDMDTVAFAVEGAVEGRTRGFHAVDISFIDPDGNEIEPLKPIKVSMTSEAIKQAVEDSSTVPVVVHVENPAESAAADDSVPADPAAADPAAADSAETDSVSQKADQETNNIDPASADRTENASVTDGTSAGRESASSRADKTTSVPTATIVESNETTSTDNSAEEKETADTLSFDAGSFSVYAIVYTVDFHWEVDGKMYEFSIPGGGYVSFYKLVEALEIAVNDTNTEKDEIQELVDGVERIEFSSPELVRVSKVEENTTVGEIKDLLGLECEYSAELTQEQIKEINAQTLETGDWALISMRPFDSVETMNVIMKNGEVFAVKVTDAKISTQYLSKNGSLYEVTVIYGEDAKIPEGASLQVTEYNKYSEEYRLVRKTVFGDDETASEKEEDNTEKTEDAVVESEDTAAEPENTVNTVGETEDAAVESEDTAGEAEETAAESEDTEDTVVDSTYREHVLEALDITIVDRNGEPVEPEAPVAVRIVMKKLPDDKELFKETVAVQHLNMSSGEVQVETVADTDSIGGIYVADQTAAADFTLGSFSQFAITYYQNNPRVVVNVHYVDNNGTELNGTTTNVTADINQSIELSTYQSRMNENGYTYLGAHYGTYSGQVITSLKGTTSSNGSLSNSSYIVEFRNGDKVVARQEYENSKRQIDVYLMYAPSLGYYIQDTIGEDGCLTVKNGTEVVQTGTDQNLFVKWYSSSNGMSGFQEVTRSKILNGTYNVPVLGGPKVNVSIDEGADQYYRAEIYKVENNQEVVLATTSSYHVPYYDDVRNGGFETPYNNGITDERVNRWPSNWQVENGSNGVIWKTTGIANDGTKRDIEIPQGAAADGRGANDVAETLRNYCFAFMPEGNQCAELNCEASGALYQDVLTIPGSQIYWSLYHRARGGYDKWKTKTDKTQNTETDTMYVVAMPTELAEKYDVTTQQKVLSILNHVNNHDHEFYDVEIVKITTTNGGNGTMEFLNSNYSMTVPPTYFGNMADGQTATAYDSGTGLNFKYGNTDWHYYTGNFSIPADQYLTRFFFVAGTTASGNPTMGNFLDDIKLSDSVPAPNYGQATAVIQKTVTGLDSLPENYAARIEAAYEVTSFNSVTESRDRSSDYDHYRTQIDENGEAVSMASWTFPITIPEGGKATFTLGQEVSPQTAGKTDQIAGYEQTTTWRISKSDLNGQNETTIASGTGKEIPESELAKLTITERDIVHIEFINSYQKKQPVSVWKTDMSSRTITSGAVFDLYKADEFDDSNNMPKKEATVVVSGTTGTDGILYLGELAQGEYRLLETKAPDGYILPETAIKIIVTDSKVTSMQGSKISTVVTKGHEDWGDGQADDTWQIQVWNNPGVELPSTGGPGTTILYLLGFLLTALAGAGLMMKSSRRKNAA